MEVGEPVFKLENPRFSQYLRLYWQEIREFLLSREDLSLIAAFADVAKDRKRFDYVMEVLADPLAALKKYTKDPDMGIAPLIPSRKKKEPEVIENEKRLRLEAIEKQYELVSVRLQEQEIRGLMFEILHNEAAIKVLDELLEKENYELYCKVHLYMKDHSWGSLTTFKERFFKVSDSDPDQDDPKFLDRISAAFDAENALYEMKNHVKAKSWSCGLSFVRCKPELPKNMDKNDPLYHRHWARCVLRELPKFPLPKSAMDDWFFVLVEVMTRSPYNKAVLSYLLPDYENILAERAEKERIVKLSKNRKYLEDLVDEADRPTEIRGPEGFFKFRDKNSDDYDEPRNVILRPYQEELVHNAIEGKNTVVCAPTGAGKTEVCIFVAMHHIEKRHKNRKSSRVVMVVPKVPLVDQQKLRFHDYVRGRRYVDGFHGCDGPKGKKRAETFLACDIVVMTPQILINMLNSPRKSDRIYVCDISLLIFDEVHHCGSNHAYRRLMDIILEYPHEKPQILGLTASLLSTAATNVEHAMVTIHKLLANVSALTLSTVQNHLEDLEKHVPKPDEELHKLPPPNPAPYANNLIVVIKNIRTQIMSRLKALTKANDSGFQLPSHVIELGEPAAADVFLQRVRNLKKELQKVDRGEQKFEPLIACDYLLVLANGLAINNLMPAIYSFNFIDDELKLIAKKHHSHGTIFYDIYKEHRSSLENTARDEEDKPIVAKLKSILVEQFERDRHSRGIIFVNQRSTAYNLKCYLNRQQVLGGKNDFGFVTSTKEGKEKFGQGQEDQRLTLRKFNEGKLKCVVSTSVIDEGIDVKACNLIIKYNTPSSAVSRIQKSGRARARNSKSWFLCLGDQTQNAEFDAIIAEKMMRRCIANIILKGPRSLAEDVKKVMEENERERERNKRELEKMRLDLIDQRFDVMCQMGNHVICKSDDISLIESHYVVTNPDVWSRIHVVVKGKKQSHVDAQTIVIGETRCVGECSLDDVCKEGKEGLEVDGKASIGYCGAVMGKVVKFAGVYLPTLNAGSLALRKITADGSENPIEDRRNGWKSIANTMFYVREGGQQDLNMMGNAMVECDDAQNRMKLQLDILCDKLDRKAEQDLKRKIEAEKVKEMKAARPKMDWDEGERDENEEEENQEEKLNEDGVQDLAENKDDQKVDD